MKASVIAALTWAACTMASPIGLNARELTGGEDCTCELETVTLTIPAPTGTIGGPTAIPPVTNTDTVIELPTETATETATETGTETAPPTSTPTPSDCEDGHCHGTGHLVQDLGPQANHLLTVTGADGESFLVNVSEDVYDILEGRVSLSDSIGEVIGDAASIGDLVADLGPIIDCILTIVGEDSHTLLVQLAPDVADLLRGTTVTLGLDSIANPVGQVVKSLGLNLKRDVKHNLFNVKGLNGENIVVDLAGDVGNILHHLHLSGNVGTVIDTAIDVTQLLQRLGPDTEDLLVVLGSETGALLIRLSPEVSDAVSDVLPKVGAPLGNVVAVTAGNL
ncbi:uncharacterized protein BJX67DRAFT_46828 [Aspergillus lucknowensis]|uniref:Uncharacterized protein n=1 Tax=Aspergillus lucknowensis TaxID=176173 RepID=A0ABR4LW61_9EURO